jgi:hypothetical protein
MAWAPGRVGTPGRSREGVRLALAALIAPSPHAGHGVERKVREFLSTRDRGKCGSCEIPEKRPMLGTQPQQPWPANPRSGKSLRKPTLLWRRLPSFDQANPT